MAITYESIATTTLGSAASSVTFSSISGSYTDLKLVINGGTSNVAFLYLQYNSDATTNYSNTYLYGTGATAGSNRNSNTNNAQITGDTYFYTSVTGNAIIDIMNYSNTTTYKTAIARQNNTENSGGYAGTGATAVLWRSTAAINEIKIQAISSSINRDWITGSTFTLYGIKAA